MTTTTTATTTNAGAAAGAEDQLAVAHLGDLEMRYLDQGEGPPLLLLHGFTGAGADWRHVFDLRALARQWRLIVPDLRGHGGTSNPGGQFSHRQCARDVLALLDRLQVDRCRAIGLSLGGNTLLHLATQQPHRVQAMVTVSSPSYFPREARAIMSLQSAEGRSEAEWAEMRGRHRFGDEQIRALWRQARAFADSHDDMCFTPPLLATITARTLIVTGDRDPLYPLQIFVDQYRDIPGSTLYVVPGGGHGPIFLEARAEFVRVALAFLGQSRREEERS
jgi:pimeloyl-ACP methyl ester carboxylesterase